MSAWTKEFPKESGFYWLKLENNMGTRVDVVEWDVTEGILTYCGNELHYSADPDDVRRISGYFWPERLQHPPL